MNRLIGLLCLSTTLWAAGCDRPSDGGNLDGRWRGTVTERGRTALVELEFHGTEAATEGTFTILSKTGQDADKGMVFRIVQFERSGNNVKFIVPISKGRVDDDAIAFELVVQGETLKGHGHELRKGSDDVPVTFTRQR